jgi:hypothetical protein
VPPRDAYLTELCVGGVDRVFAVGQGHRRRCGPRPARCGSTLAAYQTYADDAAMRDLARALVEEACASAHGHGFDGAWPAVPLYEAISRAVGATVTADVPADRLRRLPRTQAYRMPTRRTRRPDRPCPPPATGHAGHHGTDLLQRFPADAAVAARPKPDGTDSPSGGTSSRPGRPSRRDGPFRSTRPGRAKPTTGRADRDDALALALEYGCRRPEPWCCTSTA